MFKIKNMIIFSSAVKLFGIRKNAIIVNQAISTNNDKVKIKSSFLRHF